MERIALVGFGIAGAALAATAPQGIQLVVYDQGGVRCSSRVATGLVNPIVLKRRRVVWRAAEALDAALLVYPSDLRSSGPIFEVLRNAQELNDWQALGDHPALGQFLGAVHPVPVGIHGVGLGEVRGSFRLNVGGFLDRQRAHLEVRPEVVETLEPHADGSWTVNGSERVDHVLLAEGYQARWAEKFWGPLGFARTWGQGLKVSVEHTPTVMLHRSHFLIPDAEGGHQLGASFGWGIDHGDQDPPEASLDQTEELVNSAREWIHGRIEVQGTWTGIRPNTQDRRPRWGWHPEHPTLGMLNGLGSRGTLHAPLLAQELWDQRLGAASAS
jgi:glycine oxidase